MKRNIRRNKRYMHILEEGDSKDPLWPINYFDSILMKMEDL